jgi:hypothetical protein
MSDGIHLNLGVVPKASQKQKTASHCEASARTVVQSYSLGYFVHLLRLSVDQSVGAGINSAAIASNMITRQEVEGRTERLPQRPPFYLRATGEKQLLFDTLARVAYFRHTWSVKQASSALLYYVVCRFTQPMCFESSHARKLPRLDTASVPHSTNTGLSIAKTNCKDVSLGASSEASARPPTAVSVLQSLPTMPATRI